MTVEDGVLARLRGAQKSAAGAPAYSRFVNRPLGRLLAALAYRVGLSPSQVTLISGATTAAGIGVIAVARPTVTTGVVAALLLVAGYALDAADGQLARVTGKGSLAGEWLDHLLDAFKACALHLAVLVAWYRFFDLEPGWLLVPLVYAVVSSTFFFGVVGADLLRRIARLQAASTGAPRADAGSLRMSPLYSIAVAPADYGTLCIAIALLGFHGVFTAVYGALALLNLLVLVISAFRWYRSLKTAGAEGR